MFEQTAVFERGIGEVTDVVEKELFRIAPRTEESESWALRPEPTAGIVRAYLQHGMQTLPQPVKLTATGPMFRYDRPQAGRYRQFWQFDVEAIGDAGPAIDAEIIELGNRFYAEVGVEGVEVQVNSIGDATCRPAYIEELTGYYRGHVGGPAGDGARPARAQRPAPAGLEGPGDGRAQRGRAADHRPAVRGVRRALRGGQGAPDAVGVPGASSPRLVRGLDYYTRTAFEFYVAGREGQQQALGGGGRYDGLVELLGGRPTPGIGFGLGLDRVALVLGEQGVAAHPSRARWPSSSARTRGHGRAPADRDGPAGGAGSRPRGPRPPQARAPAGGGRQGRRAFRGDHRRRARGRARSSSATSRGHPARGRGRRPRPRARASGGRPQARLTWDGAARRPAATAARRTRSPRAGCRPGP